MTPRNRDDDRRKDAGQWPVDRDALRHRGERQRDAGMSAAAWPNHLRVKAGQVAMLDAMFRSPDGTASIDDATPPDELREAFACGGQWRGSVPVGLAKLGLIEKFAVGSSDRPSRHAGARYVWRLVDRAKAIIHRGRLKASIDAEIAAGPKSETPPAPSGKETADGASDGSNPTNQEDSNRG